MYNLITYSVVTVNVLILIGITVVGVVQVVNLWNER